MNRRPEPGLRHRLTPTVLSRAFRVALGASALACLTGLAAHAQPMPSAAAAKVSPDLARELHSPRTDAPWARVVEGRKHVMAVVVTDGSDDELRELQAEVRRWGGRVHRVHRFIQSASVVMPAVHADKLAHLPGVVSVMPNRPVRGMTLDAMVEEISGASTFDQFANSTAARDMENRTHWRCNVGAPCLMGTGVGIAVLDSGTQPEHISLLAEVPKRWTTRKNSSTAWTTGSTTATSLQPGSPEAVAYETAITNVDTWVDRWGHGTHVASIAAGRRRVGTYYFSVGGAPATWYYMVTPGGIAPGAKVYDMRVLGADGTGNLNDVIEGIEWIIYSARQYGIRVMNLSLTAGSNLSWRDDPLARAVRSATAAGIVVVVAAGNSGPGLATTEVYGGIGSPAHDPSVITVGAVNSRGTYKRSDDRIARFSSRGPTRGSRLDSSGTRIYDHLVKPDVVAPGNRIPGAASKDPDLVAQLGSSGGNWFWSNHPSQLKFRTFDTSGGQQNYMLLSGTSMAAPVVAGPAALLLAANPGLTPPLVKAILQYTAQPVANAGLLHQGTGQINIPGALALARALRTDLAQAIEADTIKPGDPLLAAGKTMPAPQSTISGETFTWSQMAVIGGSHVVSGPSLFTVYSPIWDPRLTWANGVVERRTPEYWPAAAGVPANTYVRRFNVSSVATQPLVATPVRVADVYRNEALGVGADPVWSNSALGWLLAGSGNVLQGRFDVSGSSITLNGLKYDQSFRLTSDQIQARGLSVIQGPALPTGQAVSGAHTWFLGEPD